MGSAASLSECPLLTVEEIASHLGVVEADFVSKALSLQSFALVTLIDEYVERQKAPMIADISDIEGDPQLRLVVVAATDFDADGTYNGEVNTGENECTFYFAVYYAVDEKGLVVG